MLLALINPSIVEQAWNLFCAKKEHFIKLSKAFIDGSLYILYYLGVWIDSNHEVMYALASKITFICQMDFNAFPVDIQVNKIYFQNHPVICIG